MSFEVGVLGIFKFLKDLFNSSEKEAVVEPTIQAELNEKIETKIFSPKQEIKVVGKSVDDSLKELRRLKYSQSNFNLKNNLECEVLNYLVAKENSNYNVYWNLYVPYGIGKYMQIDHLVVTDNTIYMIECKDYKTCTSLEVFAEHWECYYNSGKVYKSANGADQNRKHINVLKKYLKDLSFEYKSIVALVVDNNFEGYIPDEDVILVRKKEEDLLYKLLDRKIKNEYSSDINNEFVEVNKKIYSCMNPSEDVIKAHRDNIKEKYK